MEPRSRNKTLCQSWRRLYPSHKIQIYSILLEPLTPISILKLPEPFCEDETSELYRFRFVVAPRQYKDT